MYIELTHFLCFPVFHHLQLNVGGVDTTRPFSVVNCLIVSYILFTHYLLLHFAPEQMNPLEQEWQLRHFGEGMYFYLQGKTVVVKNQGKRLFKYEKKESYRIGINYTIKKLMLT